MYCLLEYVLTDDHHNRKYVVIKFSADSLFSFTQEYLDERELIELARGDEYETNFFIRNGFLNWEGKTIPTQDVSVFKRTSKVFHNKLRGLYELLGFLVNEEALFIPEDSEDSVVPFNSICISKTTMNIYFARYSNNTWEVSNIVKNTDSGLSYSPFKFLLPTELSEEFRGAAELIGYKTIGGMKYFMYLSEPDLLLYPLMTPSNYVPAPLLNFKSYMSELYNAGIEMLDLLLVKLTDQKESPELIEWEITRDSYSRYGVGVKLDVPKPTKQDLLDMVKLINNNITKLINADIRMQDLVDIVTERAPGELHIYAFKTALGALLRESYSELDKLNSMEVTKAYMLKEQAKLDLDLYMYRAMLYISDFEHEFGTSANGVFEYSGWSPYTTRLTKVKEL